ncbi:MAG: alpha-amylase family glycosyl hydrolase, partial [Nitriliruptorales bacterium]
IFYGTEQADDGNGNPNEDPIANEDNRKMMETFDETSTIFAHIRRLNELRAHYPALQRGTQREMWEDEQVYAFSRQVDTTGDETITVSNGRWDEQARTIPLRTESSIAEGTTLTNLLNTSDTVTVTSGGPTGKEISMALGEHETKVYAPGTPVSSYTPPARNITRIRIHYDVGWGNSITVRGDTYPLRWDEGRGARNLAPDLWEWEMERIPENQSFEFKVLINDTTWSTGDNYIGTGGSTIDVYPTF